MVSQLAFFTSLAEAIKKFLLRIIRPNPQSWWDLLPVQDIFLLVITVSLCIYIYKSGYV